MILVDAHLSTHAHTSIGRAIYIGPDGKQTRPESVEWPTVPEDIGE